MRVLKTMIASLAFALLGANAFADITGVYIRCSQTTLEAIQIVETLEGQLTGRYESYALDDAGKLSSTSVGFDGSISKHQLVIHLRKSLDTLFTTQSLSGELQGSSLNLTWEGGAGAFQKAQAAERNGALEQLNALGAQIVWANKADRAEKTYNGAETALNDLNTQAEALDGWMDTTLSKYDDFAKRYKKRKRGLAALEAMNADVDLRYKIKDEIYRIESDFYSLKSDVEQRRSSLRWKANSIGQDIEHVEEFCSGASDLTDELAFCLGLSTQTDELTALVAELSEAFAKWDYRKSRPARK